MITRFAVPASTVLALTLVAAVPAVPAVPAGIVATVRHVVPAAQSPAQGGASQLPDSVLGVFEGRTPCSALAAEFTGFPLANCEKIKWELALHHDPASKRPTTYEYQGTRSSRRGAVSTTRGIPSDADAIVYRLHYQPAKTLALLRIDTNILLILDRDLRPMVGDASWSYTLSRTDKPRR